MQVRFTAHALRKFALLRRHGVSVSKRQVVKALEKPERIDYSRLPLLIAQAGFDRKGVLRVVYRTEGQTTVVVTFYPGKRSQYEKET